MKKYYLYILHSSRLNIYYIGISHDPDMRLGYHNSSKKGFTVRGRPWKLVFKKEFINRIEAQKWKTKLKKIRKSDVIKKVLMRKFDWNIE